jgi:predicted Zn-dependent protease
MENLLTLCDRVIETALKAGADEAEAMAVRARDVNVELSKNDLQIARSMSGDGLGLRIFKGGSLGFAYVNSFDEPSIAESVERALGIAAGVPGDENNVLPDPTPIEPLDGILDEKAAEFGVETAVERTLAMLRTAREFDPRVTVDSGELAGYHGEKAISTSRGVRASERSSFYYCYIARRSEAASTTATSSGWPRRANPSRPSTSSSTAPARRPLSIPRRWPAGLPKTSSARWERSRGRASEDPSFSRPRQRRRYSLMGSPRP